MESVKFLPYDMTSSYRSGSKYGPREIRIASDSIESYSNRFQRDLENLCIVDEGDLSLETLSPDEAVKTISDFYREQYQGGRRLLGVGGEHTVTIGAVRGIVEAGITPYFLHLDAHLDLRDEYTGGKNSHACVGKRVSELVGIDHLLQWGMRSGSRTEYEWAKGHHTYYGEDPDSLSSLCSMLRDEVVYISMDLDLFDTSQIPGVGNAEPGGLRFEEFLRIIGELSTLNIIGADIVELSPVLDPSGRSSVFAATVMRELLLAIVRKG